MTSSGFVPLALSPHFSLLELGLAVVQGQITVVDTDVNLTLLNAVVQTGGPLDFVSVVSGSLVLRQGPVKNTLTLLKELNWQAFRQECKI